VTFTPSTFTPSTFTPAAQSETWSARAWSAEQSPHAEQAIDVGVDSTGDGSLPSWPSTNAPRVTTRGAIDDEVAAMLALRSDIQEQALAELGQLAAYRPSAVGAGGGGSQSLQRRVPSAIPVEPETVASSNLPPLSRDPEQLRRRLSNFQSGTVRGRRDAEASPDDESDTAPPAAHPNQPDHTPASTW